MRGSHLDSNSSESEVQQGKQMYQKVNVQDMVLVPISTLNLEYPRSDIDTITRIQPMMSHNIMTQKLVGSDVVQANLL